MIAAQYSIVYLFQFHYTQTGRRRDEKDYWVKIAEQLEFGEMNWG